MISRRALLGLLAVAMSPYGFVSGAVAQGTRRMRVIHVLVALCDNVHQGIVPVPAALGNGDDPARNLYWGAAYGVKTYFRRARDWRMAAQLPGPSPEILERLVFHKMGSDVWLVADAYRGAQIRKATEDVFSFAAGHEPGRLTVEHGGQSLMLPIGGGADLIAYVGHDGLMDFALGAYPKPADGRRREAVVLACASRQYFSAGLRAAGASPLVLTTNLMAPEAYVLKAIVDGWAVGEEGGAIRDRAARAYSEYQKISFKAARRLFSD